LRSGRVDLLPVLQAPAAAGRRDAAAVGATARRAAIALPHDRFSRAAARPIETHTPDSCAIAMSFEVFFLNTAAGRRFCAMHAPALAPARGWIVQVHAFGEEMNKSRRMAALQARAFSRAGFGVLQIDLHGCGDSAGDFGDASWQGWIDDVVAGCRWVRERDALSPLWLWGVRAGCLLAVQAAARLDAAANADAAGSGNASPAGRSTAPCHLLFWQPAPSGRVLLQQFLRLRMAGDLIAGGGKGAIDALRRQLAAGTPVEVAGYTLAPALAIGLEQAVLQPLARARRVEWLELAQRTQSDTGSGAASVAPASAAVIERWRTAGARLRTHVVHGPAFWQTTEIEEAPELIDATLAAIGEAAGPGGRAGDVRCAGKAAVTASAAAATVP
jgi:alpha/beta superfamily hydrolase